MTRAAKVVVSRSSKATRGLLYYLRQYLKRHPDLRRPFRHFHKAKTGRTLHYGNLSRYLALKAQPNMDTALALLSWLHERGELLPGKPGEGLFLYAHPEFFDGKVTPEPARAAGGPRQKRREPSEKTRKKPRQSPGKIAA